MESHIYRKQKNSRYRCTQYWEQLGDRNTLVWTVAKTEGRSIKKNMIC